MTNIFFIQSTIEIFGSIIMAVAAMMFVIITGNKRDSEKNLFVILLLAGFSLLMAACWYLCDGETSNIAIGLNQLCNLSVFIGNPIMAICINRYVYNLIKESGNKASLPWVVAINVIAVMAFIIPITNLFHQWMYYFDEQNMYHRLDGWNIYTALNSLAMVVCVVSVVVQRKLIENKSRSIALYVFFIVQFIGVVLQATKVGIPFVQVGTALGSLWVIGSYLIEWMQKEKDDASEDKKKVWLIECVFSIMILFISAAIITCAVSVNTVSNESSEQNSTALAYMVNATVDSTLSEPINVSKTMAQSEIIIEALSSENIENTETEEKMLNFLSRIKDEYGYQTLFVASEKTKAYYTYSGFSRYMDIEEGEFDSWYTEFKNKPAECELNIDADKDNNMQMAVFVNIKVRDKTGEILGVCGVAMSMESCMEILAKYQENYNLDIFLTDRNGLIQLNTDRKKIENEILELPDFEKIPDNILYERVGNIARLTRYLDKYDWFLVIEDFNPSKLNVFRIILPSMIIYILGVIIMLVFSLAFATVERKRSREIRVNKLQTEMAKAASEAKGRFLANMSHEIRTPLNAVLGMDTMILRESHEENIREYAMSIHDSGNVLLSLINDILDISKIESGKMEIVPVKYDFSTLIHDVLNMVSVKAKTKGLDVKLDIDKNLPSELYGDDVRIRQILVNLMNNAIKYTEKGNVTLIVKGDVIEDDARECVVSDNNASNGSKENVSSAKMSDENGDIVRLRICVKDTGIGIKEEDIQKLFDDFVRIEESRNKNIEGTGLGMSITVQLLDLMNSKLDVDSVYGEGSEFSFVLDQKIVDIKPIGDINYEFRQKAENYNYEALFTAPDAKVLVVDDNDVNRMVFINLLKDVQVQIDEADCGQTALDKVFSTAYDIIFLDHMMPDMDGIEVLKKIKAEENHPNVNTPIIVLTANAISGVKEQYMSEGFSDYLSKPVIPEQLERMMFQYLPEGKKCVHVSGENIEKNVDSSVRSTGYQSDVSSQSVLQMAADIGNDSESASVHGAGSSLCADNDRSFGNDISDLPVIEGVDWNYAMLHFSGKEALMKTLQSYVSSMGKEADRLQELYDEENLNQYRIKIHALKSNSALLGIVPLAGMALTLERAAREELIELIRDMTPYFIGMWLDYRDKLSFALEDKSESDKKDIDDSTLIVDYINQLKDAMELFDVRGADSVMDKLKMYNYDEKMQAIMDKLSVAVSNLDTDEVISLCDEMQRLIND